MTLVLTLDSQRICRQGPGRCVCSSPRSLVPSGQRPSMPPEVPGGWGYNPRICALTTTGDDRLYRGHLSHPLRQTIQRPAPPRTLAYGGRRGLDVVKLPVLASCPPRSLCRGLQTLAWPQVSADRETTPLVSPLLLGRKITNMSDPSRRSYHYVDTPLLSDMCYLHRPQSLHAVKIKHLVALILSSQYPLFLACHC